MTMRCGTAWRRKLMRKRVPAVSRQHNGLLSLQDSAINTIVKNIGGYRDLIKKKISPPMRKIVFDKAMERKKEIEEDQLWAALPYLDQHRTTKRFSTKDFASVFYLKGKKGKISKGRVSMEEFLQYLVEFVPNLRVLKIHDPKRSYPYPYFERKMFKKIRLQPIATDLLLKMENLTKVSITNVYINFSGFVRVCRESRKLQSIEAWHILIDIEPINSMKDILETLGSKFDHQEYDEWRFPRKMQIILKKTNAIKPYGEATKVTLSNDFLDLVPPGLTKLEITTQRPIDILTVRNRLLRNLRRVGGTLNMLILKNIRPELNITLQQIFEHCHELETLHIIDSCMRHGGPIASFGKLKNFKWTGPYTANGGTVRLDKIFSAPLLEYVHLATFKLDLGYKESLFNRIRNHTILTKFNSIMLVRYNDRKRVYSYRREWRELARKLRSIGVSVSLSTQFRFPI